MAQVEWRFYIGKLTPRLVAAYTDLLSFCVLFFFSFFIEEVPTFCVVRYF